MTKRTIQSISQLDDPIKQATLGVLTRVLDPLVDLMFDSSVTVHELSRLTRQIAVHNAARRVVKESGRPSKSRVAIMTGLPRSEVARILRQFEEPSSRQRFGQHPARKVLSAWFDNPRFLTSDGDPAILPIFGKRRSFESLVISQSPGTPVRAMLDELAQLDAVEIIADRHVRAKSRIPVSTGLSARAIHSVGERTRDLLETLTKNLRRTSPLLFEGTAVLDDASIEMVSVARRELTEQGASLINSATSLLRRSLLKSTRPTTKSQTKCRLGVTVYYFQDEVNDSISSKPATTYGRRKNLQRTRNTAGGLKAR